MKKLAYFLVVSLLALSTAGCFLFLAGAAGGGGTAVWLSGKLTQEFNSPFDRTISASEAALKSLNYEIKSEKKDDKVAQLKSNYSDGKEIWIDIRKTTENSTKVEVRVGAVNPDKDAAQKILKTIQSHL